MQPSKGLRVAQFHYGYDLRQFHHNHSDRRDNYTQRPNRAKASSRSPGGAKATARLRRRKSSATGVHRDSTLRLHHVHRPQRPVLRRLVFQLHYVPQAYAHWRCKFVPAA